MMETKNVPYSHDKTVLNGFLAWDPGRTGARPGVLVVHGGAGLDDHARGRALRFAEWGFIAFACDMYGEGVAGNLERVIQRITELRGNPDTLCQRAQAGLDILRRHPSV